MLRTMFDPRNNLANEVAAQLDQAFRRQGVPHHHPAQRAPRRGAVSFGKPAMLHDKDSRGALAYLALAGEMLRKEDDPPPANRRKSAGDRRRPTTGEDQPNPEPDGTGQRRAPGLDLIPSQRPGRSAIIPYMSQQETVTRQGPRGPARQIRPRRPRTEATRRAPSRQAAERRTRRISRSICCSGASTSRGSTCDRNLEELADSIRAQGVMQPIVVRPSMARVGRVTTLRDHRRRAPLACRADGRASHEMPAVIRKVPDEAAMAMALIENIQRENLNPLEEARALERLIANSSMTHQQAADAVGRSRAAVSNLLRLLELADEVKRWSNNAQLEMGHARALLGLTSAAPAGGGRRTRGQKGPFGARNRGAGAPHARPEQRGTPRAKTAGQGPERATSSRGPCREAGREGPAAHTAGPRQTRHQL